MDMVMPHKRILLIVIAIGFVGGFTLVSAANSAPASPEPVYSAAG
jgi:hypothetical protein